MVRLLLRWVLNALTLLAIAYTAPWVAENLGLLRGFRVEGGFETAAVAVAILAILNLTVRPVLKLLTLPITCLTFGLFTLIINALMMLLTDRIVKGFEVGGLLNAVIASILFTLISAILNTLFNKEEDDRH